MAIPRSYLRLLSTIEHRTVGTCGVFTLDIHWEDLSSGMLAVGMDASSSAASDEPHRTFLSTDSTPKPEPAQATNSGSFAVPWPPRCQRSNRWVCPGSAPVVCWGASSCVGQSAKGARFARVEFFFFDLQQKWRVLRMSALRQLQTCHLAHPR